MASEETEEQAVVLGDEFVADEILARLSTRCAVRCTMLSKRFRQLLASPHFRLRHRRLGAPLELPHVACLLCHYDFNTFYFHAVSPTFVMKHTVIAEHRSWYAGTCHGLVLVSGACYPDEGQSSINGVVFNPATKEEACLSLVLPSPGKEKVCQFILGFGYGPASKVYKALIREEIEDDSIRLMVVSLNGSCGQEPRTVFSSDGYMDCQHNLHTANDKVYFLMHATNVFENLEDILVLAFDVDKESVTRIATPEGHDISRIMMLKLHGRPCIYTQKGQDTIIWLLTTDHRWEQLYILVNESSLWDDNLLGAWECGDGLLFANFSCSGAYLYNLNKAAREGKEVCGSGTRLVAVSSLKTEYKRQMLTPKNLWDYQPTLISPTSIFDDIAFSDFSHESVPSEHELDETFLEMTQKWVVDPMMHMLSTVRPPSDTNAGKVQGGRVVSVQ